MEQEKAKEKIKWAMIEQGSWTMYLAATEAGLCYIGSPEDSIAEFKAAVVRLFPCCDFEENREALATEIRELSGYLSGAVRRFSAPVDLRGTSFQRMVWKELQNIPYGQTCSYEDIAVKIGRPKAARAVGAAIGRNPVLMVVPCHRVIGKGGKLTGYRGGLALKKFLLEKESGEAAII